MTTQNSNKAAGEKKFVNIGIKIRGSLACDNKYFDRTCPSCGSMFNSYAVRQCPSCQQPLVPITAGNGKAMGISEGTFYLLLSKKDQEFSDRFLKGRKGAMPIKYRFKMFSFADTNGVLAPHPLHNQMRSGALIEFVTINHPPMATKFFSKKLNCDAVELMYYIFASHGDSIKVVAAPKEKADVMVSHTVDANGDPAKMAAPFNPAGETLAEMQKRLNEIMTVLGMTGQMVQSPPPAANPIAAAADAAAAEFYDDSPVDEVPDDAYDDVAPF